MLINDAIWRAKQLCEVPNGRMGPRLVRRMQRNLGPSQYESWCNPKGHPDPKTRAQFPDLVGQIFFKTNDEQLDTQDRDALDAALDYWRSYHANFYRRVPVLFKFVGNADYRGSDAYNKQLALKRSTAVKRLFDDTFSGYPYYLGAAESLGETKASRNDLAGSRRVDIFTSFVIPMDQSIAFENQALQGAYRGPRSRRFKIRVIAGGGVSVSILGGSVMSIEVLDPRTERTAMYILTSTNVGLSAGVNRPTEFGDIDTKDFITIDDLEGNGGVMGGSLGFNGVTFLRFEGPRERGITDKPIVVPMTGWDLNVGFNSDGLGYWHRIGG